MKNLFLNWVINEISKDHSP